jgi:hypothetical protein
VDAVNEIVSYEIQGEFIRFNFDKPRCVYPSSVITISATIFVGENTVEDGSEKVVIKQLRKMLKRR